MTKCDIASKNCQSGPSFDSPSQATQSQCGCCTDKHAGHQAGCPVEAAAEKWKTSFCTAMQAVQVDMLKERIRKEWGPVMDKVADATVKAMGAHWESMLTQAQAKKGLREEIQVIFQSAQK